MPIKVKHEADLGGLAMLALMAGATQTRTPTPRISFSGGGGGGGFIRGLNRPEPKSYFQQRVESAQRYREGEIAAAREAQRMQQQAAIEGQLHAQRLAQAKDAELAMMQEQEEAAMWKYDFTQQQRQRLARNQNARQLIESNPDIPSHEKAAQLLELDRDNAAIRPTRMPKTSEDQQQQAWAEEGTPLGGRWIDPDTGSLMTRNPDGKLGQITPYKDTVVGIQAALQVKREEQLSETRLKLMDATTKDAMGEERLRYGTLEIEALLEKAYPWYRQQRIQEAMEADDLQERIKQTPWPQQMLDRGMDVQPEDISLPEVIGKAQAIVRTMRNEFGKTGPPKENQEARLEYEYYLDILDRWLAEQDLRGRAMIASGEDLRKMARERGIKKKKRMEPAKEELQRWGITEEEWRTRAP